MGQCFQSLLIRDMKLVHRFAAPAYADVAFYMAVFQHQRQKTHQVLYLFFSKYAFAQSNKNAKAVQNISDADDPHCFHAGFHIDKDFSLPVFRLHRKYKSAFSLDAQKIKHSPQRHIVSHRGDGKNTFALQNRADRIQLFLVYLAVFPIIPDCFQRRNRRCHRSDQFLRPAGLQQIFMHPHFQRLLRVTENIVRGQNDVLSVCRQLLHLLDHLKPADPGQIHIHNDDIRKRFPEQPKRFRTVFCRTDDFQLKIRHLQSQNGRFSFYSFIFYNHHTILRHISASRGISRDTIVPHPASLSMVKFISSP